MDGNGRIGHHTIPLRYRYVPAPQVYINSHWHGETVNESTITVSGEAIDANEVTINGVQAIMDENLFSARISLKEGQNGITVIAKNHYEVGTEELNPLTYQIVITKKQVEGKATARTIEITYDPSTSIVLQSLTIMPQSPTVPYGGTFQLKATGTYSNGQAADLTQQAQWTSSDYRVTVNNGLVKGISSGSAVITATFGTLTATVTVTVGQPELKSITISYPWTTPDGKTVYYSDDTEIKAGETIRYKAFGYYTDGSLWDLRTMSGKLTWSSSNTAVATIDQNGLSMALTKGTTVITVTHELLGKAVTKTTTLTVRPAPIYLFITSPTDFSTIKAKTATVMGKILGASSDTAITVNGIPTTITGDTFTVNNVPLTEGRNILTATATEQTGQTASQSITVTVPPAITLKISSPTDGSAITGTRTTVRGTISNWTGNETGITVNGIPATVYNGQFTANVQLTEGPNTITVTATDTTGNTAQAQTTVTATTPANYVKLTSNIESGTGPLEVTFTVDSSIELTATNAYIAYTNPTQVELLTATPNEYKARINAEGIYDFIVQATDNSGNVYQDLITITVLNKTEIDNLLKAKWEGMKGVLMAESIDAALMFFAAMSQDQYKDILIALKDHWPTIFSLPEELRLNYVTELMASYDHVIDEGNGDKYVYPLTFIKDGYGLWKIVNF